MYITTSFVTAISYITYIDILINFLHKPVAKHVSQIDVYIEEFIDIFQRQFIDFLEIVT